MPSRKLTAAHIAFLVFGVPILIFGFVTIGKTSEYPFGIGIPVVGGLVTAVGLSGLLPKKVLAGLVVACGAIGAFGVIRTQGKNRERWGRERLAREMTKVCDGQPVEGTPNGAKLRVMKSYRGPSGTGELTWQDENSWPADDVPRFALCIDGTTQTVQSGTFYASGSRQGQTLSTYTHHANVKLRKIPSGEVVFEKSYDGGAAPALPSSVVRGGSSNTNLSGSPVSREAIAADLAPYLAAQ